MKKVLITMFALAASVVSGLAAEVTGKWTGQMSGPDGSAFPLSFTFKQDGAKLTGATEGPGGTIEIRDGKVEGDKISFIVNFEGGGGTMKITHSGTIMGDEITLNVVMEGGPGGGFAPIKLTRGK